MLARLLHTEDFMLGILLAAVLATDPCGCETRGMDAAIVWRGSRTLSLDEIAGLLAPVLWFSGDEPLLLEGRGPIPGPHPCDPRRDGPVVYYQVRRFQLSGDRRVTIPARDDPDLWSKVRRLNIRFYFYYPEDRGSFGHRHDLELAELEVSLENTEDGCRRLVLDKVTGFAHGLDWYNNELAAVADTAFPLTLIVEEGKHASCPDRNADGIYTPGYDVNRRINDAWGVRDVMGSGVVGIGGFRASMAKPRAFGFRVVPPESPLSCVNSSFARSNEFLARYELRAADEISTCDEMEPDAQLLTSMMDDHRFGSEFEPGQGSSRELREIAGPFGYTMGWLPPIALRRDRSFGISVTPLSLELGQFGYLAAKINVTGGDLSFDGLITPSASHFFSWYVSAGAAREYDLVEFEEFEDTFFSRPEWRFATEVGVKFRARVTGKWRILSLGYHFAGIRLGVRTSGLDNLDNARLIIEIGAGVL